MTYWIILAALVAWVAPAAFLTVRDYKSEDGSIVPWQAAFVFFLLWPVVPAIWLYDHLTGRK